MNDKSIDEAEVVEEKQTKPDTTGSALEMEDPFDDPALVTNAFLDIMWQDAHGNSALMLAAAENRILHVKGILTMASERGLLWQVLNMRNDDGQSALEMALRTGSDTCAMLITEFAKQHQKRKPRWRGMSHTRRTSNEASETDITIEMDDAPSAAIPFASRRPFVLQPPARHLSRDRITKNLKRVPPTDYVVTNTGRTWYPTLIQRSMSGESLNSLPSPASNPALSEGNKATTVGEKLRSIFNSKKENRAVQSNLSPKFFSADDAKNADEVFRSPWPPYRPTRLPPLANLRRRTASESRTKIRQDL
ncbi:hypothetical protein Q1695_013189 [Nippostrongylus brasiliensis]|nr:hypothetical protein Q1695_013189 [Nippostrongylus brasiliensis]